ncbi:hypothetical protein [Thalassotalea aquiviva]|uniref:hypothetical protein n=1 Tax=Thalassotalea aquiviva TaxID=3242415 RepID=UPI00352ACC45
MDNHKAFDYLTEMGIPLWTPKAGMFAGTSKLIEQPSSDLPKPVAKNQAIKPNDNPQQDVEAETESKVAIENPLPKLLEQQFFKDILLSLNHSEQTIVFDQGRLLFENFIWALNDDCQKCSLEQIPKQQPLLTTPMLNTIADSPSLKASLWQMLQQQLISY